MHHAMRAAAAASHKHRLATHGCAFRIVLFRRVVAQTTSTFHVEVISGQNVLDEAVACGAVRIVPQARADRQAASHSIPGATI